jgi:hypothetical protein
MGRNLRVNAARMTRSRGHTADVGVAAAFDHLAKKAEEGGEREAAN